MQADSEAINLNKESSLRKGKWNPVQEKLACV